LVARGEFSIAVAGLATTAGVAGRFEALAVTYVFLLAILGPILVRVSDPIVEQLLAARSEQSLQPMP
jgi:monovalent cation:H+ antiporter-2, CPA2 family